MQFNAKMFGSFRGACCCVFYFISFFNWLLIEFVIFACFLSCCSKIHFINYFLKSVRTNYSRVLSKTFDSIQLGDSGIYYCVVNLSNKVEEKVIHLKVSSEYHHILFFILFIVHFFRLWNVGIFILICVFYCFLITVYIKGMIH